MFKPQKTGSLIVLCCVCEKPIAASRSKALIMLGKPTYIWSCVTCSTEKKVNGIYMGEVGTSELRIVDKVYDDSVRGVFHKTEVELDETEDDND